MSAARDTLRSQVAGKKATLRLLAEQAFSRVAGAPLVEGNRIQLLRNGQENYPSWLAAMESARETIHFESYIIHSDAIGQRFADLMCAKAREGVRVRVIYDWFGARGASSWRFWRRLRQAGVEVRCFNPPRLDSPLGWLSRDHRKTITVDGRIGFVSGLCVGQSWIGNPRRGIEPWRDTGVAIEGPAVFDLEQAFAAMWLMMGTPVPAKELLPERATVAPTGNVPLRIVPTLPGNTGLYRVDQLNAALASNSIWLTDAYFMGTSSYVQALCAAARDGVDVRLLLPRTSDIPVVRSMSRVGYRALLEAGVRIFEWKGSMLHAKAAVADGHWARVGSTNLNVASWLGNCELDVIVEDEDLAHRMEEMYLEDLGHSTEIVLQNRHRVRPAERRHRGSAAKVNAARGSAGRAATGVLAFGSTVNAAFTSHEFLGRAEVPALFLGAGTVLAIAIIAVSFPRVISIPIAVVGFWMAFSLFLRILRAYRRRD